jgi:hypothetical protein
MIRAVQKNAASKNSVVACIRCHGNVSTEPLPSNYRRDTYIDTDWWEEFIKYAVEMDSGIMTYIPIFRKSGLGIKKLMEGATLLFFQNKESSLEASVVHFCSVASFLTNHFFSFSLMYCLSLSIIQSSNNAVQISIMNTEK